MDFALKRTATTDLYHGELAVVCNLLGHPRHNKGRWLGDWLLRKEIELYNLSEKQIRLLQDLDLSDIDYTVKRDLQKAKPSEVQCGNDYQAAMSLCRSFFNQDRTYQMIAVYNEEEVEVRFWNGQSVHTYS